MRNIIRVFALLTCIQMTAFHVVHAEKNEMGLNEVITKIRINEQLIKDIRAEGEWQWLNPKGHNSSWAGDFKWGFRSDWKQYLFMLYPTKEDDGKEPTNLVFNGHSVVVHLVEKKQGNIMLDDRILESRGPTPKTLLGYSVGSVGPQYATLYDKLMNGRETRLFGKEEVDGHRCFKLQTYIDDKESSEKDFLAERLVVWIDPECSYRPRKIELYRNDYNMLSRRFDNVKLEEVEPGIWLAVEADDRVFTRTIIWLDKELEKKAHEPGHKGLMEFMNLPREQRHKAVTSTDIRELRDPETGAMAGKKMVVKKIIVNKGINDDEFKYTIPAGTKVHNDFTNFGGTLAKDLVVEK